MDAVRAEISAMEAEYERASNANDYEAVVAYYAEDAKSFPPNMPMRDGKAAILASMNSNPSDSNTLKLTVEELWAEGNVAVERGTYEDLDTEGMTTEKGRYISIFEKRDGKYICIRDIWNSQMPKTEGSPSEE